MNVRIKNNRGKRWFNACVYVKTKFTGPGSLRDVVELYSPNAVWSLTHFLKSQRPSVITAESFIETFELSCRKKSHDSCGCSSSFWSPGTSQSQR